MAEDGDVPRRRPQPSQRTGGRRGARSERRQVGAAEPARPVGWATGESAPDGEWLVRAVPGAAALKPYRCPGCEQVIPPGAAHVVAWPADAAPGVGPSERRHWHRSCWRARANRRPR